MATTMDGTNPMLSIPSHSSLPNLEVPIPARPVLILATGGGCSSHRRHPRILDSGVGQKEVFGVVQVVVVSRSARASSFAVMPMSSPVARLPCCYDLSCCF
ncbi:Os01g0619375 [Oryza sativa Japonica Group]|uniref:Os01g0619375 protein n=2 Tax=Oryza TaxID=4527 RepID=A0A0P0V5D8_ORYSJ|nr:Os01g0619375 [Oryza sativa Japonica Group]